MDHRLTDLHLRAQTPLPRLVIWLFLQQELEENITQTCHVFVSIVTHGNFAFEDPLHDGLGKPAFKTQLISLPVSAFLLTIVYSPLVTRALVTALVPSLPSFPPTKFSPAACVWWHLLLTLSWPSSCDILSCFIPWTWLKLLWYPVGMDVFGCLTTSAWKTLSCIVGPAVTVCWHVLMVCEGLQVLKANPSDPPVEEIMLGSLGCRPACVE